VGQGQNKPNLTGEWKLNPSKSEFGRFPAPIKRTDKVDHADPSLRVLITATLPNGETRLEINYLTDGTETTNDFHGNPMKSTCQWEGETLRITSKVRLAEGEMTVVDRVSLSQDGKTMTIHRHASGPQGQADQTMVSEKQ